MNDRLAPSVTPSTDRHPVAKVELPPLLVTVAQLSRLTSLGVRTLRRMDAAGDIPGRVTAGRAVRFRMAEVEAWIAAGLPDRAAREARGALGRAGR